MRTVRLKGAGVGRRTVAALIDGGLVSGVAALPWLVGWASLDLYIAPSSRYQLDHVLELWILRPGVFISPLLWWTALWIGWHAVWLYVGHGQTPGCRAMRLRFLDRHADPLRWGHLVGRAVGHALSVATLGLGWVWVLVSSERRSVPDVISGTYLVDER